MNMSRECIALAIKTARERRGLSQAKLANQLGITYQALSNYERGRNRVPIDMLKSICKELNISIESVVDSSLWEDGYYEDFLSAKYDSWRLAIIEETGCADPRLICEYNDLLKASPSHQVKPAHSPSSISSRALEIARAYDRADEKSRELVDLTLREYLPATKEDGRTAV